MSSIATIFVYIKWIMSNLTRQKNIFVSEQVFYDSNLTAVGFA